MQCYIIALQSYDALAMVSFLDMLCKKMTDLWNYAYLGSVYILNNEPLR